MFSVCIQTDTGENTLLTGPGGYFAGKTILTFMMGVLSRCDDQTASTRLPSERALCAACAALMKSTVNSQWNYCDGEDFQKYVARTGDRDLTEEAFLRAAAHYQAAWTDIQTLLALTQSAILHMEIAPSAEGASLSFGPALVDFRALHAALDTALAGGAKRARIDIH